MQFISCARHTLHVASYPALLLSCGPILTITNIVLLLQTEDVSSLALAVVHGDVHAVEHLLGLKTTDVNETTEVGMCGVARRIRCKEC